MLSRIIAACLTVLTLSPFTAPFRTLDLAMFWGSVPAHQVTFRLPKPATRADREAGLESMASATHICRVRSMKPSGVIESG